MAGALHCGLTVARDEELFSEQSNASSYSDFKLRMSFVDPTSYHTHPLPCLSHGQFCLLAVGVSFEDILILSVLTLFSFTARGTWKDVETSPLSEQRQHCATVPAQ